MHQNGADRNPYARFCAGVELSSVRERTTEGIEVRVCRPVAADDGIGTSPIWFAMGDFNRDGKQDLVVVDSGMGKVFGNRSPGKFNIFNHDVISFDHPDS